MPDRQQALVVFTTRPLEINHGSADNISFFVNVTFPVPANTSCRRWWTSNLFEERMLNVFRSAINCAGRI
jgi:hypothetical protein